MSPRSSFAAPRLLAGVLSVALFLTCTEVVAQSGSGAKYGTRDLPVCTDSSSPSSGAPSAEQAARYVRCSQESRTNDAIGLVENLKVQVARGRPYEHVTDSWESIDPRQPVYPIRGSFTSYTCDAVYTPQQVASGFTANRGRNCSAYEEPQASGVCYRTSFGDWRCRMYDIHADPVGTKRRNIPPP